MTSEENVKRALSVWLEQFNCGVAWEKKNKYNYPVFKCDSKEMPDILITHGGHTYMCEVKKGDSKSNVYDSLFQILRYATKGSTYTINGMEIKPDGFLVATEHSIKGHLFDDSVESLLDASRFHEGRNIAIYKGELPAIEYNMTEQYTRILWRGAMHYKINTMVGVLLCNVLNGGFPFPMFLYKLGKQQGVELWK